MPPSLYTQTRQTPERRREESSHDLSLSGEIIHHKTAPLIESSNKTNPCGDKTKESLKLIYCSASVDLHGPHIKLDSEASLEIST